ncbi:COG1470 family protein [Micromonosporaceae bacterium Da 78-11]
MELTLPTAPVTLAPGVPTRVPVQLRNPYPEPLTLRIFVARGRAAGWATVDPPTVDLDPGETATVDVVLRTPATQPPSTSLVPFTVHAEESTTGEPAGFATALLTVALPIPVAGDLAARPDLRHAYDLRLVNDTGIAGSLRITATLEPPAGTVEARPDAVQLEPGATVTVAVRARPKRPLIGTPKPYAVVVAVQDAFDPDRPPYLTAVASGKRTARVPSMVAGGAAIALALGATAAIALSGLRLPLPGRHKAAPTPAPAGAVTVTQVTVGRPYALIDVFPHRGADGGKAGAEAAQATLVAAGMPVRLVDSLSSDVLVDSGAGFWVLLQDGFASPAAAQAYCTQWRPVAPKCAVTS